MLSENYIANIKSDLEFSQLEKYEDTLSSALYKGEISRKVYDVLITSANKGLFLIEKYHNILKKEYKLKKLHSYDRMPAGCNNKKFTYDNAFNLVIDVTRNLEAIYLNKIPK